MTVSIRDIDAYAGITLKIDDPEEILEILEILCEKCVGDFEMRFSREEVKPDDTV